MNTKDSRKNNTRTNTQETQTHTAKFTASSTHTSIEEAYTKEGTTNIRTHNNNTGDSRHYGQEYTTHNI